MSVVWLMEVPRQMMKTREAQGSPEDSSVIARAMIGHIHDLYIHPSNLVVGRDIPEIADTRQVQLLQINEE